MKELDTIIEAYKQSVTNGKRAALATVVAVEGSAYRRPGAKMLVIEDGSSIGSVSGGCLERAVIEQCLSAIQTNQAALLRYDSTHDDDIVLGSGSGCPGSVLIFIESLNADSNNNPLTIIADHRQEDDFILGTIIQVAPCRSAGGSPASKNQQSPDVGTKIVSKRDTSSDHKPKIKSIELDGTNHQVFMDSISPPNSIVILGAGHDSIPLAEMAHSLGFRVSIYDHRKAFADPSRFPYAEIVAHYRPEVESTWTVITKHSYCIVMAHNYLVDKTALAATLQSPSPYVGALGPKSRTERMLQELRTEGLDVDALQHKLYAPVGLDIGAETPQEIALSILAEIQSVIKQRKSGSLRDRNLPIHETDETSIQIPDLKSKSSAEKPKDKTTRDIKCQTSP